MEFLGGIISGQVTAIAHFVDDLTDEQRQYMAVQKLEIPRGQYETLGGPTACLVFGDFIETLEETLSQGHELAHMYLDYNKMIAVFPKS